ncbi:Hypothetical predicted protein [Paramuricea clavata]|uniref:Peptidase M12B propeptide domain-containing protein n=1 Tax=Paramuricea clavata TaxID=317549 RepID=A0A6S7GAL8_PARCT|nr:Hypothetical predicted protein [Paramuricea clavata]
MTRSSAYSRQFSFVSLGKITGSQVLDYDVSYLTPVNERGEEISQRRTRRDITNKKQAFYNISILGLTLHLNLTLNRHLIAPCFHIETKHSNGSTTKSGLTHGNFYHGYVISYPGSKVALSGRGRLRGAVAISDDHLFEIHPLPDHLSKNHEKDDFPHLVIKRSIIDKPLQFDDDWNDLNETFIEKRSLEQELSESNDGGKNKFLEVIYVADRHAIELYGLIDLPEMLLSIGNIVSQLIYGMSYGDPKVVYVINKIRLLNDGTVQYNFV